MNLIVRLNFKDKKGYFINRNKKGNRKDSDKDILKLIRVPFLKLSINN